MAKYTKNSKGYYRTTVELGHDKEGKRVRKDLTAKTIKELEKKVESIRMQSSYTVGMYAEHWLNTYKTTVELSTRNAYKNIIDNHINILYDKKLTDLSLSDIQNAINIEQGHWDIQRRIRLTLKQMFDCAIEEGELDKNPARMSKIPKKPSGQNGRVLTKEEKEIVKNVNLAPKEECFLSIALYTGMRPEEIRGLMKSDIDLEKRTITVSRALSYGSDERGVIKEPKTESGYRTIPIVTHLQTILEAFLPSVDNWLFCGEKSLKPLSKSTYRRMWSRIRSAIGTDITPYVFRHNFATQLYYSGIDLKDAKRLMGHSDIRMILDVYSHLDGEKSNADKLNEIEW